MGYNESTGGVEGRRDRSQSGARHRRRPPTEIPFIKLGGIHGTGESNLAADANGILRGRESRISAGAVVSDVYILIKGVGLAIDDDGETFSAEDGILGGDGVTDGSRGSTTRPEEPHDIAGGINPGFDGAVGAAAGLDKDFRFVGTSEGGEGGCDAGGVLVEVLGEAGDAGTAVAAVAAIAATAAITACANIAVVRLAGAAASTATAPCTPQPPRTTQPTRRPRSGQAGLRNDIYKAAIGAVIVKIDSKRPSPAAAASTAFAALAALTPTATTCPRTVKI
jgi:hypothetical protein